MKKQIVALICMVALAVSALAGCGGSDSSEEAAVSEEEETAEDEEEDVSEDETAEDASGEEDEASEDTSEEEETVETVVLEDGVYTADFDTDSSMFHVNEALDGKGTLTVEDGEMTIHVSLVSQSIVNLYLGLAEDAQAEDAVLLEPTVDEVTYSDGITEEVYGFDIPVPYLDEEFDLAIIGTKGVWYDHKVSVSNPVPVED